MGIQLKPSVYVSGILAGKLLLRPAVYLSAIVMGKTKIQPAVFVTCVEAAPKTKVTADTRRDLIVSVLADTRRDLPVQVAADTERQVYAPVAKVEADTARTLTNDRIHDVASAFDTRRDVGITHACFDLQRNLSRIVKTGWDTHRKVAVPASATGDTRRTLKNRVRIFADTQVRVPFRLDCVTEEREEGEHHFLEPLRTNGIRSLSFTLGELTLSDTFQLETVQPLKIGDAIEGRLMDYHFHFLVEETSQRDLVQSVKGMYDRDALLYTSIFITVKEAQVLYYAYEIARAMGWELSFHCDNFIPSQDYEHSGMTYQDFVSSLFGWTSRLPHRQVNVFLRGNTLHVIQRGQEQGVIDITDWPHGRPTIERRLVRSVWSSGNNDSPNNPAHNEEDEEPIPFSGTISFQNITRTYRNGYLVDETSDNGYAHYAYADGYLIAKQTHNTDGSTSITHYAYATTANDYYLFCEQEHATDAIDDGRVHDRYDWKDTARPSTRTASSSAALFRRENRAARPASTPSSSRTSASAGRTVRARTKGSPGRRSGAPSFPSRATITSPCFPARWHGSTGRRRKLSRSKSWRESRAACQTSSMSWTSPSASASRGTNIFSCRTRSSSRRAACGRQSR